MTTPARMYEVPRGTTLTQRVTSLLATSPPQDERVRLASELCDEYVRTTGRSIDTVELFRLASWLLQDEEGIDSV